MKSCRWKEILSAFFLGSIAYLVGGLASLPFERLRDSTLLLPRVPLIAVGIGGLILGLLIDEGKRIGLVRFFIISITSYLAVILINLITMPVTLGQELTITLILYLVFLPPVVYSTVFGLQAYGFSALGHFFIASMFSALPAAIVALLFFLGNNKPLEYESLWMYAAFGSATSVSIRSFTLKR